eukprot:gene9407-12668_t
MSRKIEEPEPPSLEISESYFFAEEVESVRLMIEWLSKDLTISTGLDLVLYCYDERARLVDTVDRSKRMTKDEGFVILTENAEVNSNNNNAISKTSESLKADFKLVSQSTSSILLFLDGGPRNFQHISSVSMSCFKNSANRNFGEFLPDEKTDSKNNNTFKITGRTRKNYLGLALCVIYRDGWNSNETPRWAVKTILEPLFVSSEKAKEEKCTQIVVSNVPALEKYRPRLFSSIRELCAALSSHALPKLKKKFQRSEEGLPIGQFTEVLFKQLAESHPKILEDTEAPYAVSMLQEMFYQIDINGDSTTNWDEFTTFCVQTGVINNTVNHESRANEPTLSTSTFSLDQYTIEYGEELLQRDHVLSAYRLVSVMHFVRDNRRIIVIPEDSDNIMILDEKYRIHAQLYPSKLQVVGGSASKDKSNSTFDGSKSGFVPRPIIYDAIYLSVRDLYAYCSSDHSITICKEMSSLGGKKINYLQHNRFYHNLLHLKLCWSGKHDLLCSAASDRTIYGWNVDTGAIIFQIQRHSDSITEFLCIDSMDMFITCSMDKRIVLWSSISRRVKGILIGHKRGVRSISVYENTLLSAGFECEAKIWDITTKENMAILKGHRHPVAAAVLMCERAQSEKEYRAITVDESGEFRLWNIYVKERSSGEPVHVPCIQTFEMLNPETPINRYRFLAVAYNPRSSTSYYSNLVACSTKLLHFVPEKNVKEFVPPAMCCYSDSQSNLITAVGKNILVYDVSNGLFTNVYENVSSYDITSICLDGERGRRIFAGNTFGEFLLISTTTGAIIDCAHFHERDITSIRQVLTTRNVIYTSGIDGHLRMFEENSGKIHVHNSIDHAFGEGIPIMNMKVAPTLRVIVCASNGKLWGVWHDATFKKLLIIHEPELVTGLEIIGCSRDRDDIEAGASVNIPATEHKENILSLAVAMQSGIVVYTFDVMEMRGIKSVVLTTNKPMFYSELALLKSPDMNSVNYSIMRASSKDIFENSAGYQLVAVTDDGHILLWDTSKIRAQCDVKFRRRFKGVPLSRANFVDVHMGNENELLIGRKSSSFSPTSIMIHGAPYNPFTNNDNHHINLINVEVDEDRSSIDTSIYTSHAPFSKTNNTNNTNTNNPSNISPSKNNSNKDLQSNNSNLSKKPLSRGSSRVGRRDSHTPLSKHHKANVTISWVELTSSQMFAFPFGEKAPTKIMCKAVWVGHHDSIPCLVPMNAHSCFVTVSHDGYHRVWNLDQECLGELFLPNVTEQMRKTSFFKDATSNWKFILERLPIRKHHIEIAAQLVKVVKHMQMEKISSPHFNNDRRAKISSHFKGFHDSTHTESKSDSYYASEEIIDNEQAKLRKQILLSLNEPSKPSEDAPPSRLPTKEEKELLRLSNALTGQLVNNMSMNLSQSIDLNRSSLKDIVHNISSPDRKTRSPHMSMSMSHLQPLEINASNNNSNTKQRSANRSFLMNNSSGPSDVLLSAFGEPSLWYEPGAKDIFGNSTYVNANSSSKSKKNNSNTIQEVKVNPAFSESSLNSALKEGLMDPDAIRMLRRLAYDADKVEVYERSQPIMLLRNPSMSVHVELPNIENIRKAEINFGQQK